MAIVFPEASERTGEIAEELGLDYAVDFTIKGSGLLAGYFDGI